MANMAKLTPYWGQRRQRRQRRRRGHRFGVGRVTFDLAPCSGRAVYARRWTGSMRRKPHSRVS